MSGIVAAILLLGNIMFMALVLARAGVWAPIVSVGTIFALVVSCAVLNAGPVQEQEHAA